MLEKKHVSCDLCVIGGGMAGLAAAVSAARAGAKVALMHERPGAVPCIGRFRLLNGPEHPRGWRLHLHLIREETL